MAWTTPRTWTTGEAVTSAMFNSHIRDLFNFIAALPHEAWLKRTSDYTVSNDVLTTVSWQSADRNVGDMWTSGSDVTIQEEGLYAITANAQWATGSAGNSNVHVKNGTTILSGSGNSAAFGDNYSQQRSTHTVVECQPGDVITMVVRQNSGSGLDLQYSQGAGTSLKVVQVQRRLA